MAKRAIEQGLLRAEELSAGSARVASGREQRAMAASSPTGRLAVPGLPAVWSAESTAASARVELLHKRDVWECRVLLHGRLVHSRTSADVRQASREASDAFALIIGGE